jgi:methyl-accepting chemotaxis protein
MERRWGFGRKVGSGFALVVLLGTGVGVVSNYALKRVVQSKDEVLDVNARGLLAAQRYETAVERRISAIRGYLLTREQYYLNTLSSVRTESEAMLAGMLMARPELSAELERVKVVDAEFRAQQEGLLDLVKAGASSEKIERKFIDELRPSRARLSSAVDNLTAIELRRLEEAKRQSTEAAETASALVTAITLLAALVAAVAAGFLTRGLGRQIGAAVGQVQSSSAELQTSAKQQASGLRQQATAMAEITTTISELLATSRQIALSAQKVSQIAREAAGSARSGDETVSRAHTSISTIQRQVELIVNHMLELGRKSQQIGSVLEIVSELAEQTNILAINATIEATGAGESGRRFAVVADEIRKLADRVAGSTKEIRALIDEVRSAVNTTVMATETGSKTVEAGSRQFGEVALSLRAISGLVGMTSEAAREIELSTQQQSTAVEQVNVAIASVTQGSRETETSATQTLQTASQLATLSRDLLRVVQPEAA